MYISLVANTVDPSVYVGNARFPSIFWGIVITI